MAATLLALVLVLLAIAPPLQTWVAQRALADRPGVRGSLESLSAGFGGVDVENLNLDAGGVSLKLPSLQARLPVTAALLGRRLEVRRLVARGWTLELRGGPTPAPGRGAADALFGLLGGLKLPIDGSLDGVELEGDVVVDAAPGGVPARVHVLVTGGGMSAGHEGAFVVEATAEAPGIAPSPVAVHARLTASMDSPRSVNRIALSADLPDTGGPGREAVALSAAASLGHGDGAASIDVGLSRGVRRLAMLQCRYPGAARRLTGTWAVDLRDADLGPLARYRALPSIAATGGGQFDADPDLARVHALGGLRAAVGRLEALAPALRPAGAVALEARFELTRDARSVHVERLSLSLAGARPAASARALQPFDVDLGTGAVRPADPRGDWIEASVQALPLAWLSGLLEQGSVEGGDAAGGFVVRAADGGFALRPTSPLSASGVTVRRSGRVLARDLDVTASLSAESGAGGWRVRCSPAAVGAGGARLATLEAEAGRSAGADQPIEVRGTWKADLEALASRGALPLLAWARGRSASGEFSASIAGSATVQAKVQAVGLDPTHTIAATVRADVSPDGTVAFEAPLTIATGPSASDIRAEGTWVGGRDGDWIRGTLTGSSVASEHLRLLAAPLAAAAGGAAASHERDRAPFWGDWTGHVAVAFDKLATPQEVLSKAGAVFDIERGSVRMSGGRASFGRHLLTNVSATLTFDPAAERPYRVQAAVAAGAIDAAPLFPPQQAGRDPLIEGRFSVQAALSGSGANLDELRRGAQTEFRLTSAAGIVRVLRANVAESLPEPPASPVSDSLDAVGSAVGAVFGIKGAPAGPGKSPLSKVTDAVLNFTYQVAEIGYDQASVRAVRESDGTIRLVDIEVTAADEHLRGSGRITPVAGQPLSGEPLSVELRLGVRGKVAELLATAGLLSADKDALGYALLSQPIRLAGTLGHIDTSSWNDLLVQAATRKPQAPQKPADGPAGTSREASRP